MIALSNVADAFGSAPTIWLGVGLGLRHATDADHFVAVSALVEREQSTWRAAGVAACWGLGHTASFLALGAVVVLGDVRLPVAFEHAVEALVGAMLVLLGVRQLVRPRTVTPTRGIDAKRPLAVGLIHGTAGSTAIALLAATTIGSSSRALLYLVEVALGTVLGMSLLTIALSAGLRWAARVVRARAALLTIAAALASVALGATILADAVTASHAGP